MKTLTLMILACGACLAQPAKPADADLQRQRMEVRREFDRKAGRLSAADLAAVKAVLAKYPDAARGTNTPSAKPAPAKK